MLQEHGYDQLTVDAVASEARASKSTVYRRWPSKAELVLAAFIEGVRQVAIPPNTGTLRGDLISLGEACGEHGREHASTIRAVMVEVSRHPALNEALQEEFLKQRKATMQHVLQQAVDRGEITEGALDDELVRFLRGRSEADEDALTRRPVGNRDRHRSTPPITGSMLATAVIRSATMPPSDIAATACRFVKDGSR